MTDSTDLTEDGSTSDNAARILLAEAMLDAIRSVSVDGLGVTRPSYGAAEGAAHGILARFGEETGMVVRTDEALNTWVQLPGTHPDEPMIVTGSHLDSVRNGGNFDGAAGVVAGLLTLRELQRGPALARTVAVVAFRGEESAWFGTCYAGSRALVGHLEADMLASRSPESNLSLGEVMTSAGADMAKIEGQTPLVDVGSIGHFIEVHIEQGPDLLSQGVALGAVTGIRGNRRYSDIRWSGEFGHSGAVPRTLRHDAVLGVSEWIQAIEQEWISEQQAGADLVMTSGILSTDPLRHGVTSIPGAVKTSLDIRSVEHSTLERFDRWVLDTAADIAGRRGLQVDFGTMIETAPAVIASEMVSMIVGVAQGLGQPIVALPSGAGHDAAALASAGVDVGMIFVRNSNGSHNPDEAMETSDLCAAVPLLVGVIRELGQV